jgi:enolase-phosphatase E1
MSNSSGSIVAQQLLFAHSTHGDLTALLSGYFDTTSGPKLEAKSYRRIAAAIGFAASGIVFLSDSGPELDAAGASGMRTLRLNRSGAAPDGGSHPEKQLRGHPFL